MVPRTIPSVALASLLLVSLGGCVTAPDADSTQQQQSPIIGGDVVTLAAYGTTGVVVALRDGGGVPSVLCTGTLVAPNIVLTAAHCVSLADTSGLAFTLANSPLQEPDLMAIVRGATYPAFSIDPADAGSPLHDIGVFVLATADTDIAPEPLPGSTDAMAIGALLTLIGYGPTEVGGEGGVKSVGNSEVTAVSPYEFVAGGRGGPQACFGDSGGPAYITTASGREFVGVASRAALAGDTTCSSGSVYTRIDAYLPWIRSVIEQYADHSARSGSGGCEISAHSSDACRSRTWSLLWCALLLACRSRRKYRSPIRDPLSRLQ